MAYQARLEPGIALPSSDTPDHAYGLEEIGAAVRYRRYLYELIAPHLPGTVLEAGAGHGDFAALFPEDRHLVVSDVDPRCVEAARARINGLSTRTVRALDPAVEALPELVDSAVAINVLEHVDDDVAWLRGLARSVRPGGSVVLLVPGYQALWGPFDQLVGHRRRYTPSMLSRAVQDAGLSVASVRPVNFIGGLAWWLAVRLGKRVRPRPFLVRLYDTLLVPLVRLTERRWTPPFGQSVLCVATRPG